MRRFIAATALLVSAPAIGQSSSAAAPAYARPYPPPVLYRRTPRVDPGRLAAAQSVVAKALPPGGIRASFNRPINFIAIAMIHRALMQPVVAFLADAGLPPMPESDDGPPIEQLAILRILDPASERRVKDMDPIATAAIDEAADRAEPDIRRAMAIAYAERFSVDQLRDLDQFFDTPTGRAFASEMLSLQSDLDVQAAEQKMRSALMQTIPAIVEKTGATHPDLPKPKTVNDLSDADRVQLAQILNVPPERLSPAQGRK